MKCIVTLSFLLLVDVAVIQAQALVRYSALQSREMADVSVSPVYRQVAGSISGDQYIPGLSKRNTGATLTVIGGIMLAAGAVTFLTAEGPEFEATQSGNQIIVTKKEDPQEALGLALTGLGAGLFVPGWILWHKGHKQYKSYLNRTQEQSFRLNVGGSVALAYRF